MNLFTIDELAKIVGINRMWVHRRWKAGYIKSLRDRPPAIFDMEAVDILDRMTKDQRLKYKPLPSERGKNDNAKAT